MFALAGLTLEIEGVLPAGLGDFERPGRGELRLALCSCEEPLGAPLRVERCGDDYACAGDGLNGRVGAAEAELCAWGDGALLAALRLACALWLLPRGGLLLHGACVERDGLAHVFVGESGAGKTTLARALSRIAGPREARVIGDEVTCVRQGRVYGHPFPRRLGDGVAPDQGLPLGTLCALSQAEAPRRRALTGAEAARALLRRVFLPARDARSIALAVETAAGLRIEALALPLDERAARAALP